MIKWVWPHRKLGIRSIHGCDYINNESYSIFFVYNNFCIYIYTYRGYMSSHRLIIEHVILNEISDSLFKWGDSFFGDHTYHDHSIKLYLEL